MKPLPFKIAPTSQGLDIVSLGEVHSGIISLDTIDQHARTAFTGESASSSLELRLKEVQQFAEEVISGTKPANPAVGREIYKAVAPPMGVVLDVLTKIEAQDNLLAVYMTSLIRLQFALGEKVQQMQQ